MLVPSLFASVGLVIFLETDQRHVESRWARSGVIAFGLIGAVAGLALGLQRHGGFGTAVPLLAGQCRETKLWL